MLLLIEPTIYLLMWLASQVDIDFQLDSDGDDWDEEEDKNQNCYERRYPEDESRRY